MIGHPEKSSAAFSGVTLTCTVCTSIQGLILEMISRRASVFGMPRCGIVYICRLRLVTSTMSKSTSSKCPTPDLARLTAMLEPRPPSPAMATEAACSFSFIQRGKRSSKARSSSSLLIFSPFLLLSACSLISNPSALCIGFSLLPRSGELPHCRRLRAGLHPELRGG